MWEAFLERAADPFRVPDKVADPEGSKVLALVPRRQSRHGSVALVLPDFLADPPRLGGGKVDCGRGGGGQKKRGEDDGSTLSRVRPPA